MIEAIFAKIQEIGASVSGVTEAYDPPPANLNSDLLPALYAFTGGASYDESALGPKMVDVTREIRVQVAVIPTGQGDPNTREKDFRPLIDATVSAYQQHPALKKLARVRKASVLSDTGVVILPEWGMKYIGFEIRLRVVTTEPRTIAQGE